MFRGKCARRAGERSGSGGDKGWALPSYARQQNASKQGPTNEGHGEKCLDFLDDVTYPMAPDIVKILTIYGDDEFAICILGKETRKIVERLAVVSQLGLTMVGCIGLAFAIGYYLDKWFGARGIFLTIFILLGIAGGSEKTWTFHRARGAQGCRNSSILLMTSQ
jgi:hypothetical protein